MSMYDLERLPAYSFILAGAKDSPSINPVAHPSGRYVVKDHVAEIIRTMEESIDHQGALIEELTRAVDDLIHARDEDEADDALSRINDLMEGEV